MIETLRNFPETSFAGTGGGGPGTEAKLRNPLPIGRVSSFALLPLIRGGVWARGSAYVC